jgi:serine/threonine protein kinase
MLQTIGEYKILERIGVGALGELYRARDTRLGRTASIIVISADIAANPDRRATFLADAKAASKLSHPNIAAIYEIGEDGGVLFLAAEFMPGQPVARLITAHPLNARLAIDYATQIANALADAHAAGITHGAIDARTVVITPKGSAKILDYGLTAWTGVRGSRDEALDLSALGLLLFQMLTAKVPQAGWPVPAPSSLNRNLPPELDVIVAKLLASGGEGYRSAATVAAELRALTAKLDVRIGQSEPPTLAVPQPGRSGWTWTAIFALVVIAALALAAILTSRG